MVLLGNLVVPPLRFVLLVLAVRAQGRSPAILQTLYYSWCVVCSFRLVISVLVLLRRVVAAGRGG